MPLLRFALDGSFPPDQAYRRSRRTEREEAPGFAAITSVRAFLKPRAMNEDKLSPVLALVVLCSLEDEI